jgi:hypothetical protein
MKPLKEPGYVVKRSYHLWHQVPGHGLCPICGQFGRVDKVVTGAEFKTQDRECDNGHRFQTVVRIDR